MTTIPLSDLHDCRNRADAELRYIDAHMIHATLTERIALHPTDTPADWYRLAVYLRAAADALTDQAIEVTA